MARSNFKREDEHSAFSRQRTRVINQIYDVLMDNEWMVHHTNQQEKNEIRTALNLAYLTGWKAAMRRVIRENNKKK